MPFVPRFTSSLAALAGLLMFASAASALESTWTKLDKAEVRLLAAGAAAAERGAPLRAGLEIRMARGWYTYWRYPGDAGIPPRFDWSGSTNLATVEVRWPAPERIPVDGGLESIGYRDHVLFPLLVRAADPGLPVTLRLKLDFGVCEKICIPAHAGSALTIPAGLSAGMPALDAAEARVPRPASLGEGAGLAVLAAKLEPSGEPRVQVEVKVAPGQDYDLFAEGPTDRWALHLPEHIEARDGRARFVVAIDGAPARSDPIPMKLRLTLVGEHDAIEVEAPLD